MTQQLNILITGASSGLGKATAQELASDGHRVFATARDIGGKNQDAVSGMRQWAEDNQRKLEVVELDVTDDASVRGCVSAVLERAGHLDVIVNNAGQVGFGPIEAFSIDQARAMFDVNVLGPLRINQAVLPSMRRRRSGLLIQITSVAGRIYLPFHGLYNATKWAAESIAEGLHYDLAADGVDSIIVEPGAFKTDIFGKAVDPDLANINEEYAEFNKRKELMFESMLGQLDAGDAATPDWIADAVKNLIEMPAGTRPIRTVVGKAATAGVEALNEAQAVAQRSMLSSLGLEDWNA